MKGRVAPFPLDLKYIFNGIRPYVMRITALCATYSAVECLMEEIRHDHTEKRYINAGVAGAVAGALAGAMYHKRFDIMTTYAMAIGGFMGISEFNLQFGGKPDVEAMNLKATSVPLPKRESDAVLELKKKYPEYKHL